MAKANARKITADGFIDAARKLKCEVAVIKAVAEVESVGDGFFPDGSPRTLFEGHKFYKFTNGRYASSHPTLCFRQWTREFYGRTWKQEQKRLTEAAKLDRQAALLSASWGAFQIMGFNYAVCDFGSIQYFVNAMYESGDNQLEIFTRYITNTGLDDELRNCDFERFARLYNGPSWQKNNYAQKILKAYTKHSKREKKQNA